MVYTTNFTILYLYVVRLFAVVFSSSRLGRCHHFCSAIYCVNIRVTEPTVASAGSADSFLNHLLSPVVVPPPSEGDSAAEPAALRRPAGLGGSDLLAEIRAKQEKRASLTPKHVSGALAGGGEGLEECRDV